MGYGKDNVRAARIEHRPFSAMGVELMRMVPACWQALAAGVVLAWAVAPPILPAAPATPGKAVSPVDKLHTELDKSITLKIERQPLNVAVDMLREKSKINFVLDGLTIQQMLGFTPDQPPSPVEVDLRDVKVRTALRAILSPYGLSFACIGDTVVITTEDMAMLRQMRQRVNLDLSKVEFTAALKLLARDTATNLILDSRAEKEAKVPVSIQLEDVPLETAVRLLAEMAGLKPVRVGNVLFVTKKEIANELRADPDLQQPVQPGQPGVPIAGGFAPGFAVAPNPPPLIVGAPPVATTPAPPTDSDKTPTEKPEAPTPDKDK
jgi:hypothetical protein